MSDELTLKLSSPITEEEMALIMDYDLDHTSNIWFHTKHGKNVEFVKAIRCRECKHYYYADNRIPQEQMCVCDLDGDRWSPDSYCSFAERKEDE